MEDFKKIVMKKGFVKLYKIQYNKFKAQQAVTEQYVEEYFWRGTSLPRPRKNGRA